MPTASLFKNITLAPADSILALSTEYKADTRDEKVNLGVGIYLDEQGKVPLMKAVEKAEEILLAQRKARPYCPISGALEYVESVQNLLFGQDSPVLTDKRVCTVQSLGGTGALKVGVDFLHLQLGVTTGSASIPTWGNHNDLMKQAGCLVMGYRYYTNGKLDFEGMMEDLQALPEHAVVILHGVCHNPSGADLGREQWQAIVNICRAKSLIPFLDYAYLGFKEGLKEDRWVIDLFVHSGLDFLVACSFSKSFSLYGERIGALSIVAQSESEAIRIHSQVKRIIRANYSNPPAHGARIVAEILSNPSLRLLWEDELNQARNRICNIRQLLVKHLAQCGVDFSFMGQRCGMFSLTGFSAEQMNHLKNEFGIYGCANGRICLAGINHSNVQYVAQSFAKVLKK